MARRKFILDGDYGVDDALAALYLASVPEVEIVAVGSVHGNTTAPTAARNAIATLDAAGLGHVPVAVGAARPFGPPFDRGPTGHGPDGLGGARSASAIDSRPLAGVPAAVQLVDTLRAHPGECTVLATGPLTNLAMAVLLDPGCVGLGARVVAMGGSRDPVPEANLAHDPEAALLVIDAGWPLTMVGLDVTMNVWLTADELGRIREATSGPARFAASALRSYVEFYEGRYGRPGCPLHDPTAARVAVDPDLASYVDASPGVELRRPERRGALLLGDSEGATVRIATGVDRDRVVEGFLAGLVA